MPTIRFTCRSALLTQHHPDGRVTRTRIRRFRIVRREHQISFQRDLRRRVERAHYAVGTRACGYLTIDADDGSTLFDSRTIRYWFDSRAKGQRAMAVAKLYPDAKHGGARTKGQRSSVLNTVASDEYIQHARTVLKWIPEVALLLALLVGTARPASAQIPVFDGLSNYQLARIVAVSRKVYAEYIEQRRLMERLNETLPRERYAEYRTQVIPPVTLDLSRATEARGILQAMSGGADSRGDEYRKLLPELDALPASVDRLPADARRVLRNGAANVQIGDVLAQRAITALGTVRTFSAGELARAIEAVQADALHPRTAWHRPTARLDVLAGAAMTDLRQAQAENIITSALLEQQILVARQRRDVEATHAQQRVEMLSRDTSPGTELADAIRRYVTH